MTNARSGYSRSAILKMRSETQLMRRGSSPSIGLAFIATCIFKVALSTQKEHKIAFSENISV